MAERPFSIRVKLGEYEIEITGTKEEVIRTLDDISGIVGKVSAAFEEIHVLAKKVEEKAPPVEEKFPTIATPSGATDAIIKLLSTDWGRTPRTWSELKEAMEVNAAYYSTGSITGSLTYLTKKGTIRRIKTDRGYAYILAQPT